MGKKDKGLLPELARLQVERYFAKMAAQHNGMKSFPDKGPGKKHSGMACCISQISSTGCMDDAFKLASGVNHSEEEERLNGGLHRCCKKPGFKKKFVEQDDIVDTSRRNVMESLILRDAEKTFWELMATGQDAGQCIIFVAKEYGHDVAVQVLLEQHPSEELTSLSCSDEADEEADDDYLRWKFAEVKVEWLPGGVALVSAVS